MTRIRFVLSTLRLAVVGVATACALATPAAAQQPVFRSGAAEVTLNGRVQTQFNTSDAPDVPFAQWRLRRVRLEARVRVNDLVSGKIQPDFAEDRLSLKDAYILLTPSERVQLLVGQAHRPFSTLTQYSSLRMAPIEKGLAIRGVEGREQQALVDDLGYSNRDIGVQLRGVLPLGRLPVSYAAALVQGPVPGAVGRTPFQLVGRLEVEPWPDVQIAGAWSRRHFVDAARPEASPELVGGQAVLVSAGYDPAAGPFAIAEAAVGDFDPVLARRFRGVHLWSGYRLPIATRTVTRLEPVLRISHASVTEPAVEDGTLVTPGLNVYLGPLNRVMLNYDVWMPAVGGEPRSSLRAMFQVAF